MTTEAAGAGRRRGHPAAAARIVAAGLSVSLTVTLVAAMAERAQQAAPVATSGAPTEVLAAPPAAVLAPPASPPVTTSRAS